jgi:hypothetical protein
VGLFSRDSGAGHGDDDAGNEQSRFWQERGFIASAIVVGAVVVCLVVWLFARDPGTPSSQPTTAPSTVVPTEQPTEEPSVPPATPTELPTGTGTTTPGTPPPINSSTGGCRNQHPDQTIPRVAPPAVTWQFDADMLIPLQFAAGPATTASNGVRSCFARSPTGAVLAAMVLLGQIRNPDLAEVVLKTRVLPGRGLNRALAETRDTSTPKARGQVQFAGFKVVDYLPTRAIIQVAAELNDTNLASLPVKMVWSDGDWKAKLEDDGSFNGALAPDVLSGLEGYVRFSGNG